MKRFVKINSADNVIIALTDLTQGSILNFDSQTLELLEDIPKGHKIAITDIAENSNIIKYGMPVGHASSEIQAGRWVHSHNITTNLKDLDKYTYTQEFHECKIDIPEKKVNIYKRENGDLGIRNELWIIPTVGCVNGIAQNIVKEFISEIHDLEIDNVNVLRHDYGCSQLGEDHENTKIILQNAAKHPNAGGVLVLGLGCENNQIDEFEKTLGKFDKERVQFLICQEVEDEITRGKEILHEIYSVMKHDKREAVSVSELKFGLECGGSDGLSGITANPMLGEFSDYVIQYGGTSVLTEVPEMFGAETLLMKRCQNQGVFDKTVSLINDFKDYFIRHGQKIYENPSPGNKKGGITTLEDKSLGCTQKSGTSKVMDVLKYGEVLKERGLNLLSAPGNDLVATTALAAAGCHMVLFTTGRGSPYGGFVPTVKISTNSELAAKKKNWIDFDAGKLLSGDMTMDDLLVDFIDYIVDVANGKLTKNEINDFRELTIFKSGVTL